MRGRTSIAAPMLRTRIARRVGIRMPEIPELPRPNEAADAVLRVDAIRPPSAPDGARCDDRRELCPRLRMPATRAVLQQPEHRPTPQAVPRMGRPRHVAASARLAQTLHRHEPNPPATGRTTGLPFRLHKRTARLAPPLAITASDVLTPTAITRLHRGQSPSIRGRFLKTAGSPRFAA
jgi:hypothetical protein